jgi:uncharacterized protein YjlB
MEIRRPQVETFLFPDGNPELPALLYRAAISWDGNQTQSRNALKKIAAENGWDLQWTYWMYARAHYHTTAHEALAVYSGTAHIKIGGQQELDLQPGDVLILPAGTLHQSLERTDDFRMFGLYPEGQEWDMKYKVPIDQTLLEKVGLPKSDPIYGGSGPLVKHWK